MRAIYDSLHGTYYVPETGKLFQLKDGQRIHPGSYGAFGADLVQSDKAMSAYERWIKAISIDQLLENPDFSECVIVDNGDGSISIKKWSAEQ